ncbi:MAG: hypothetical protein U1F55_09845 [Chitinivorax sp.]
MNPFRMTLLSLTLAAGLSLSGCSTFRSYNNEMSAATASVGTGRVDLALTRLEENNKGDDKELLYFMEKGQLLQLKGDLPESTTAWLGGDEKIRIWENEYKTDPNKMLGDFASYLLNDNSRRYEGQDYEKVMLSTLLAVNHAAQGRLDDARVEIKKTHEREALIAEMRAKQIEKVEAEAQSRDVKTQYKDLKGYPVETLDDPEVTGLKNSYQSAVSHYLAGFVYEALGEPSLAAPGYRKAIELRPNVKILEDALAQVDSRRKSIKPNETDVLFLVGVGNAPARQSMNIPLPFRWNGQWNATSISFPLIRPDSALVLPGSLQLSGVGNVPLSSITSIDAMSRRALKDDMPGIILRSTIRAVAKGAATKEINDRAGAVAGLIATIASVASERADERMWRSLPSQLAIGRAILPQGKYTLTIATPTGPQSSELVIGGKHAIIPLRTSAGALYLTQPNVPAPVTMAATEPVEPPAAAATNNGKNSKKKKK